MFLSLGLVLILGFGFGVLFEKMKLPKIIGFIVIGIMLGSSFLGIIDESLLNVSATLRQIALVIILTRSGLSLDIKTLKEIGRPAILMCFVPATFEIVGIAIFGPILLNISLVEALLIGSILAAVSPAIVVPRMIKLKKENYGNDIPSLILAGASADDIYVVVIFYAILGLLQNHSISIKNFLDIPISIVLGVIFGLCMGFLVTKIFEILKLKTVQKVLIVFGTSLLMLGVETLVKPFVSISALLGIIALGMVIYRINREDVQKIEESYQSLWLVFEILLFVLVGISVDLKYAITQGMLPILLIVIGLIFRVIGVYVALIKTGLTKEEKLFVAISYLPKATVQASIGGIALSLGLGIGPLALTMAVLSILISAPLGAILMDKTYKHLLKEKGSFSEWANVLRIYRNRYVLQACLFLLIL